jgi:hypothetical protein
LKHAHIEIKSEGIFEKIQPWIKKRNPGSLWFFSDQQITWILEDYSMRTSSSLSIITVLHKKDENTAILSIITSGAGSGWLGIELGSGASRIEAYYNNLVEYCRSQSINISSMEIKTLGK